MEDPKTNPDYAVDAPLPANHERTAPVDQRDPGHAAEQAQADGDDAHTQVDPDGQQVPDSTGTGDAHTQPA